LETARTSFAVVFMQFHRNKTLFSLTLFGHENLHDSSTWRSEILNTSMTAYVAFLVAKDVPFIDVWNITGYINSVDIQRWI
jgi:hypothetical protein